MGEMIKYEKIMQQKHEKLYKKVSDIINTPSTIEKLRAKYKKEIPKSFYIEDAAQNSTSDIRSPIKDWCMRAIQCICFKNSYYKPTMTP